MQKNIKDYLHLYIGCEYRLHNDVSNESFTLKAEYLGTNGFAGVIIPILRPLSDITDAECLECANILGGAAHISEQGRITQVKELFEKLTTKVTNIPGGNWVALTIYLIKQHFDLFGFIENGMALDKTKI